MRIITNIITILFFSWMSTISSFEKITDSRDTIEINFNVKAKCDTPRGEKVCVQIEGQWPVFELDEAGVNQWNKTIKVWNFDIGSTIQYRYCRNHMSTATKCRFC